MAGSNTVGGVDICISCVLSVVRYSSLRRADHSSRGILLNVLCLECDSEASIMKSTTPSGGRLTKLKNQIGT
jgi:hypothetical protein